jgi:hypothetical protein
MSQNTDPFAPWNDPFRRGDPLAPHNDPLKRDDPFAAWNQPFGRVDDLSPSDRRYYDPTWRLDERD